MTAPTSPSWRDVAAHYNELPLWSAPFGQLILDEVPLRRGQAIIDVGAGTGFLSIELAQRCGPESSVLAVDPWVEALEVLQEQANYRGLLNVEVSASDAAHLAMPDESADVIVSNLGINNFPNVNTVLAECHRVLRPSGRIVLSSNLVGQMSEFYDAFRKTLEAFGIETADLDAHIQKRSSIESIRTQLQQAGFVNIAAKEASFSMRFADGSALLSHAFIRLGFAPGWEAVVPLAHRTAVFTALECALNELSANAGDLSLSVPMACFVGSAGKPAAAASRASQSSH